MIQSINNNLYNIPSR